MSSVGVILAALLLDSLLGEPRRWHPLVGFGRLAGWLEARLNPSGRGGRGHGLAALLLLVLPPVLLVGQLAPLGPGVGLAVLYLALGGRSLREHAQRVVRALDAGDLIRARQRAGEILSRDTGRMQPRDLARATIESVLENGSDALFGALFWFLVAGPPGVVGYRLINTLDAMWGYRNARFRRFGWAAARFDDLLNWAPARLTALGYAAAGSFRQALRCWSAQAGRWESPNAGPVMAAGAGALGVRLGGPARYHGAVRARPALGRGGAPDTEDIERALTLVRNSLLLWVAALVAGGWLLA